MSARRLRRPASFCDQQVAPWNANRLVLGDVVSPAAGGLALAPHVSRRHLLVHLDLDDPMGLVVLYDDQKKISTIGARAARSLLRAGRLAKQVGVPLTN